MIRRDSSIALFVLIVTGLLYASLSSIEPNATIFIRVVIYAIGALCFLLMGQSMLLVHRRQRFKVTQGTAVEKKYPPTEKSGISWKSISIIFLAIVVYFSVMECLGFYASAFLYFLVVVFLLDRKDLNFKNILMKIFSAFIFTSIIYIIFSVILLVQTPRGLLI